MKALIDTCIIIDALQNRAPFFTDAQQIFLASANRQFAAFITAKSVTDIYYLTHRYTHNDKDTRSVLKRIFALFDLLDTQGMDCKNALSSEASDYEDAVMIETAVRADMDCIVTRNNKDYTKSSIPVYTPEKFMEMINKETDDISTNGI